jgi:hypothetical protein
MPAAFGAADDAAVREKRRAGLLTAGGVVATAGGIALPLIGSAAGIWGIIAAGSAIVAGSGMKIAAKLRERGTRALAGDETAVAGFAKKAARWTGKKRARIATRLLTALKKKQARLKRIGKKRKAIPLKTQVALLKLKLGVLYGLEAYGRQKPTAPLVKGDARSAPVQAAQDGAADADTDDADEQAPPDPPLAAEAGKPWLWVGAAAAGVVLVVVLSRQLAPAAPVR